MKLPHAAPVLPGPSRKTTLALVVLGLLAALPVVSQIPGPPVPPTEVRPADPAAGDFFGCALSIDDQLLAVGSVYDDDRGSGSGSVYVFTEGDHRQVAKLTAADGAAGDLLGYSVALAGIRVVAGAPFRSAAGQRSGAIYVFRNDAAGWSQELELTPLGLGARDELGRAVAIDGSVVAAGAPGDDDRGSSAGAVYVFDLDAGSGPAESKLVASDGAAGDGLGFSLALSGARLLAGAPYADRAGLPGGGRQAGAVYVFERQGESWIETAKLVASDGAASALFGSSLAFDGNRAVIGARLDDQAGTNAGAVYVFERQGGGWQQVAKLLPEDLSAGDELGIAVALSGDRLLAGARFADIQGTARAGTAYVFDRGAGGWTPTYQLVAPTPRAGDELGFAVGLGRGGQLDTFFAGAYRDDGAGSEAGVVYVFEEPGGGGDDDGGGGDGGGGGSGGDDGEGTVDLALRRTSPSPGDVAHPRDSLVFTYEATNLGSVSTPGRLTLTLTPGLTCTWTCSATGGALCSAPSGSGSLDQAIELGVGAVLRYAFACTVGADPPASIGISGLVLATGGSDDFDLSNNETSLSLAVVRTANLSVTKTADPTIAEAGASLAYRVTATNLGPDATGALLTDALPSGLGCTWTCSVTGGAGCETATGSGDLSETISLPVGGVVTVDFACTVAADAAGVITNTATVSTLPGSEDPASGNDTSSTIVTVVPRADLVLTKTAQPSTVALGDPVTYTVTLANAGPSSSSATVSDVFPDGLLGCAWTCAATGGAACGDLSGQGSIEQLVTLPASGRLVYEIGCTVGSGPPGDLVNTATVTPEEGVVDPMPQNNSASATITQLATADLSITKNTGVSLAPEGADFSYDITVTNSGPQDAVSVRVLDTVPANLIDVSWTCGSSAGTGDLDAVIDVAAGESVVCTLAGSTPVGFCGRLINTAVVEPPPTVRDPDFADRVDSVESVVFPPPGDPGEPGPCASKALLSGPHVPGSTVIYEILLFNSGPAALPDDPGDEFVDVLPPELGNATANADSGVVTVGPGNLVTWNGAIGPNEVVTLTVQAVLLQVPPGTPVINQGFFGNEPTDDPETPDPDDPTVFTVAHVVEIPTLDALGLGLLALLLAGLALARLRATTRHRDQ